MDDIPLFSDDPHPHLPARRISPDSALRTSREAQEQIRASIPEVLRALIARALGGNLQAQMYLVDRVLGKPRIEIESHTTTDIHLSADDYAVIAQAAALEARLRSRAPPLPTVIEVNTEYAGLIGSEVSRAAQEPPLPHPGPTVVSEELPTE